MNDLSKACADFSRLQLEYHRKSVSLLEMSMSSHIEKVGLRELHSTADSFEEIALVDGVKKDTGADGAIQGAAFEEDSV